ncbi:P-loop containing nucleoside triphosphate hydrolase protein [Choiromyces venosus 120613-1]|uniref:Replication factor C subunit 2 n=1 Tax=Choiromyces venosus 120613-1 TaxID=1336337 RepID=A0A3N4JD08_9PEZI|nr:P-loop containing nucleoside triphosphate hydrolase protein [Choiromyces venosus 120613-1]
MASFFDVAGRRAAAAAAQSSAVPTTKAKDPNRPVPWVEKYRPKNLNDVSAQDHTISVLKRTLQSSNLPHMLFYGPPGTGKTSTVLALAKELYGPELMKTRVLELNASDERGISIVREKVKNFARITVSNASSAQSSNYPCPPYKIIILDEADSMTQDAQSALRRTMETYSKITRFCLICNYVTRIIDPLASRCSKFRFKPLDEENARSRLEEIARAENVEYEDGVIDALIKVSEGDLRKAITYLQSAARLHNPIIQPKDKKVDMEGDEEMEDEEEEEEEGDDNENHTKLDLDSKKITVKSVQEIAGVIPDQTIDGLFSACESKKGKNAYSEISTIVQNIVADGWSASQVVLQLYNKFVFNDTITAEQKNDIVLIFSEVDKRLADGSDEHLQILDLALRIGEVLAKG